MRALAHAMSEIELALSLVRPLRSSLLQGGQLARPAYDAHASYLHWRPRSTAASCRGGDDDRSYRSTQCDTASDARFWTERNVGWDNTHVDQRDVDTPAAAERQSSNLNFVALVAIFFYQHELPHISSSIAMSPQVHSTYILALSADHVASEKARTKNFDGRIGDTHLSSILRGLRRSC